MKYFEDCELKIGDNKLEVSVAEITEEMLDENKENSKNIVTYDIYMKFKGENVLIATINEQGRLEINKDTVARIDPKDQLGLLKLKDDEKPDLSVLKDLDGKTEEEVERELEEKEKNDSKEEVEEEIEEEKGEEEEQEEEQQEDSQEREEIAERYNINTKNIVRLNTRGEKITEHQDFEGLVKWAEGKEDVWVLTDDFGQIDKVLEKKQGEFEEIEVEMPKTQGNNPNVNILKLGENKVEEVKPLKIHTLDGENALATIRNEWGETEVLYCRKQEGKEEYVAVAVPEKSDKNMRQLEEHSREVMSSEHYSSKDLSELSEKFKKAEQQDKQGVPSQEEGVQIYEINGNDEKNAMLTKEKIIEDLFKDLGITEELKASLMPGQLEYLEEKFEKQAGKILEKVNEDENITYEQAKEDVQSQEGQREKGGRTIGEGRDGKKQE